MAEVVDVDSHVYEPTAIWDYVPSGDRDQVAAAFFSRVEDDGMVSTILNGAPAKGLNRSHIVRQAIWRPGMSVDDVGALDPSVGHPLNPGAWDAAARLADMDAMGVDRQVVYPTLLTEYLPQIVDRDAAALLCRAYNDWVWDLAGAAGERLHPVAALPLQAPDAAAEELDRVRGKGFRAALLRPAFYRLTDPGESRGVAMGRAMGGLPEGAEVPVFVEDTPFRRLWARCAELGVVACVHPSSGITGPDAVSSGGFADRVSGRMGVHHTIAEPIAYMQDADLFVTTALFHGLFEDLPEVRVAIAHAGTTWVPLALEKSETYLWLGGRGGVPVCLEPDEVWERHPVCVSFDGWERPVGKMPDILGDKAAWGSRYPHHDASGPDEARAMLEQHGVGPEMIDRLLGGNAAQLFGLGVPAPV